MSSALNQKSPDFDVECYHNKVIKNVKLSEFDEYYKILFFYPNDFTYVCPTELHKLIDASEELSNYDCKVFCISTDSVYSHEIWADQPRKEGGLGGIRDVYMVSDFNKKICESYGTLIRDGKDDGASNRATYILDKDNVVKYFSANVLEIGRNIDDLIRNVKCIHKLEELNGEALPCGWEPGDRIIKKSTQGKLEFFDNNLE